MDFDALAERLERVSQGYAAREGFRRDDDWFLLKLVEELGELVQVALTREGRGRPRGLTTTELDDRLAEECADVLGHVLLFAHRRGIDLGRALEAKWLRWETDPL